MQTSRPAIGSTHPLTSAALSVLQHEGQTDGLGYTVDRVQLGRGFSAVEWASKPMPNGVQVARRTDYPGPFDGLAGRPNDIVEVYSVWVGWDAYSEVSDQYDEPPLALPPGARGWGSCAWDGPRHWFAEFLDGDAAEAFALSLPPQAADVPVPAFERRS